MVATQDLVLLGLLKERPLHGYELRQIAEERLSQVVSIAPGTIYYTLKKLERAGLVERSTQREGNRPERQVFAITAAGDDAFQALLKEALFLDERAYYVFDAALYFFPYLEPGDLEAAVAKKLERLEAFKAHVERLGEAFPGRWPFHLEALRRKAEIVTDALATWYRGVAVDLRQRGKKGAARASSKRSPASTEPSPDVTAADAGPAGVENPEAIPA